MFHRVLLTGALLAATACGGDGGVWMLQLGPAGEPSCTESISHNFTAAYVPTDASSGAWVTTTAVEGGDSLLFARLVEGRGKEGTLLLGDVALPGARDGSTWTFTWEDARSSSTTSEHETGYVYTSFQDTSDAITLVLDLGRKDGAGTLETASTLAASWSESDTWDEAVGFATGQIPAADYLVIWDSSAGDGGAEVPAENRQDDFDCDTQPCALTVQSSCTTSQSVAATWLDYAADPDEESWQDLQDVGWGTAP